MKKEMVSAFAAASMAVSATPALAKKVELTPLQIQAMQVKEFETNPRTLFRSVVSVFQDMGYTIEQADFDSGLITASSATKNKTSFWDALGGVAGSGNTRATATVEELANGRSSVRLNFVSTKTQSGLYGRNMRNDKPIHDPKAYQAAFEKIDEALFVRQATSSIRASAPVAPPVAGNAAPAATVAPTAAQPTAEPKN